MIRILIALGRPIRLSTLFNSLRCIKLETRLGHQPYKVLNHPRFRAAYDFLLLREEASEDTQGIGNWWTHFQKVNRPAKIELLKKLKESRSGPVEKKFGFLKELS